jgi:tetratricopeptide (TPR) repeat protein
MRGVRPASGDGRKAAIALRSSGDEPPPITPIQGATVAADRPGFAWPPAKEAKSYQVRLLSGDGREFWRVETTGPKLNYPEGREALKRGYLYRWEVTDQDARLLTSGQFMVATESELKQLEELRPLTTSSDRADLLTAALAYRRLGCYAEAIAAFERLAKLAPDVALYRDQLADLYHQAGRPSDVKRKARGAANDS